MLFIRIGPMLHVPPCDWCRIVTFRVSCRRREMYCGHARLCVCVCLSVCLCVCPQSHAHTIARTHV